MSGRVALVSGASRGIGAAVADRLAAAGWRLSLGLRDPDALAERFPGAQRVRYDALAGGEEEWAEAARREFGRIDAVVACAGIMESATVVAIEEDALDRMWNVNVKAPRRLVRAAWDDLCAAEAGRVVLLASLSGKRVKSPESGPYAMTKHAAIALGHAIRQAGWKHGIRATSVCPGFVDTDMARAITDRDPARMTTVEDVARLVELALDLPDTASVPELYVNCTIEPVF
ncbi:NADP-dependent 3-hydroxy acid dehydrogenase YdfG [Palleronia aestuarii]|uniref:NADP-dependent 3-hydroxy acid dehydrogenase YdfG n=1 Tax=Palleronia aestuarii TaxID=568105 RepID=A0A2W7Q5U8_9RHOB|nr:SDR family NAD(P)-dependent oxidoreductase [Palleronia aestuarii]PZX17099.1 NADP-dependent 3-hydroxy acid dehydrogenase YdfG [Palleronia aestuarii]